MSRHIRFIADYNHRWPSRAVSFFRAGHSYTVKAEVRDAAIAKGVATDADASATHDLGGKASGRKSLGRVAGRDHGARRDNARLDQLESDAGDRLGDDLPVVPLARK